MLCDSPNGHLYNHEVFFFFHRIVCDEHGSSKHCCCYYHFRSSQFIHRSNDCDGTVDQGYQFQCSPIRSTLLLTYSSTSCTVGQCCCLSQSCEQFGSVYSIPRKQRRGFEWRWFKWKWTNRGASHDYSRMYF